MLLKGTINISILKEKSDQDFSFTDCMSFIVMEMLKINKVFSFDRHFDQYGFIRLPISQGY